MAGPMALFRLIAQRPLHLPPNNLDQHPGDGIVDAVGRQACGGFNAG